MGKKKRKHLNQSDPTHTEMANDLLLGAKDIAAFLQSIGFKDATTSNVYYWAKRKNFPISKFGKELIASKSRIAYEIRKLIGASK